MNAGMGPALFSRVQEKVSVPVMLRSCFSSFSSQHGSQ